MAKRLFSYPIAAEEEAQYIRDMLRERHIEFFETPASRWGFTNAAIWIKNDEDWESASHWFLQYQQKYTAMARERFQQDTGYDPNAPLATRIVFNLKYMLNKKLMLVVLAFGLFLIYLFYSLFFSLFS